jgi:hypothetical protein
MLSMRSTTLPSVTGTGPQVGAMSTARPVVPLSGAGPRSPARKCFVMAFSAAKMPLRSLIRLQCSRVLPLDMGKIGKKHRMVHRTGRGQYLTGDPPGPEIVDPGHVWLASLICPSLRFPLRTFSAYAYRSHDSRLLPRGNTEPFRRSGNKSNVPAV